MAGKCLASRRMHRGSRATHRADPPATKAEQNIMKHARGIVFIQGTLQKPAGSRTYVQIVRLDGESP